MRCHLPVFPGIAERQDLAADGRSPLDLYSLTFRKTVGKKKKQVQGESGSGPAHHLFSCWVVLFAGEIYFLLLKRPFSLCCGGW